MAIVSLRSPLRDLAGGNPTLPVEAPTVFAVLRALEGEHPRMAGWVLDEHGRIRRNVIVFVNGEPTRDDQPVSSQDTIHVLPSITGGTR